MLTATKHRSFGGRESLDEASCHERDVRGMGKEGIVSVNRQDTQALARRADKGTHALNSMQCSSMATDSTADDDQVVVILALCLRYNRVA